MTWIAALPPESDETGHEPGAELAPGVLLERRSLLWMPALAAAALLFDGLRLRADTDGGSGANSKTGKDPLPTGSLEWEEFLKQCVPVAKEMFVDSSAAGQDAYLNRVAALAVRLRAAPSTKLGVFGRLDPKVEFGLSYKGFPFIVVQWRMEAGAVLPAHCHPQFSVCTLGLEGEARLRNFDVRGEAPAFDSGSSKSFLIQETHNQVLRPRSTSTLSASRDNIHHFEAGTEGARGIDITTSYGGSGNFSFVAFDTDKPRDPKRRIFEAAWTGQKPK
jgi:hypothetical protein